MPSEYRTGQWLYWGGSQQGGQSQLGGGGGGGILDDELLLELEDDRELEDLLGVDEVLELDELFELEELLDELLELGKRLELDELIGVIDELDEFDGVPLPDDDDELGDPEELEELAIVAAPKDWLSEPGTNNAARLGQIRATKTILRQMAFVNSPKQASAVFLNGVVPVQE